VSFTTTLGRIEPREARTQNGQVTVRFISSGESGEATITAFSGGASAKLEKILVGAAAAKRITVTANPQSLPASGGTAEVIARVEGETGAGIAGVPVTFTTDAGTLSATSAITDAGGIARTTVTTDRTAKVRAAAGALAAGEVTVALSPRLIGSFSASPQATTAGTPVTFTVASGTGANVQDAVINFGDGTQARLDSFSGSATASHVYNAPGTYTATVTARDALGGSQTQSTTVTVGALPVTLAASPTSPAPNQAVTFTVAGIGTAQVSRYQWTFNDGRTFSTSGPSTTQSFDTRGEKVVRVDVIGINGGLLGSAETRINVQGG
jgi:PKD repeat protein